jgi:hypothetical protein
MIDEKVLTPWERELLHATEEFVFEWLPLLPDDGFASAIDTIFAILQSGAHRIAEEEG